MVCLIHPTYFPNLSHLKAMYSADKVVLEVNDHYQKQTFRNRADIYGSNGKLSLAVPVRFTQKNRQIFRDVKISYDENWQQLHLKSLKSAYSMSPFFEYYIDEFIPLFEKRYTFILDLNLDILQKLQEAMQIQLKLSLSEKYEKAPENQRDYRMLVNKNKIDPLLKPYTQVFSEKFGFLPDLCILDLLFNEGPASELYLKTKHES